MPDINLADPPEVKREQTFTYRDDGALKSATWAGHPTTYDPSPGGFMEAVTDWRDGARASTFSYHPAGNLSAIELGGDVAKASFAYHPDGSASRLAWTKKNVLDATVNDPVRTHTNIDYDRGGLRISEDVSITQPVAASSGDDGDPASFSYDLAGRLTSWTSPFRLKQLDTTDAHTARYDLDEAGNITTETIEVLQGDTKQQATMTYDANARLQERTVNTFGLVAPGENTTTKQTFTYSGLGEEEYRTGTTTLDSTGLELEKQTTKTEYDPEGHARDITNTGDEDTDIRYVYDADHNLIARIRKPGALDTEGPKPRLYFYWGRSGTRAEEVQQSKTATGYDNKTKIRYLVTADAQVLAQQSFDDLDQPTWTWLLRDSDGNIATHLKNNGDITRQRSYDPYGAPDAGGSAKTEGEPDSPLGFQAAPTDDVTGNVFLGPRVYDPKVNRFTTADYFVGASSDLSLGTDPLTGNRYLFAAANPVAFYEDGYRPECEDGGTSCARSWYRPKAVRQRNRNDRSSLVTGPPDTRVDEMVEDSTRTAVGIMATAATTLDAVERYAPKKLRWRMRWVFHYGKYPISAAYRRGFGPISFGLDVAHHLGEGDSLGEAVGEVGGGAAGAALGARLGVQNCPRGHPAAYSGCVAAFVAAGAVGGEKVIDFFTGSDSLCRNGLCVEPGVPPVIRFEHDVPPA